MRKSPGDYLTFRSLEVELFHSIRHYNVELKKQEEITKDIQRQMLAGARFGPRAVEQVRLFIDGDQQFMSFRFFCAAGCLVFVGARV